MQSSHPRGSRVFPTRGRMFLVNVNSTGDMVAPRNQYLQENQPLLCHIPGHPQVPRRGLGSWPPNSLSQGSAGYNPAPDLAAASSLLLPPWHWLLFNLPLSPSPASLSCSKLPMRVFALATVKTEAYPGLQGESSPLRSPVGGEAKEEEGKVEDGEVGSWCIPRHFRKDGERCWEEVMSGARSCTSFTFKASVRACTHMCVDRKGERETVKQKKKETLTKGGREKIQRKAEHTFSLKHGLFPTAFQRLTKISETTPPKSANSLATKY